MPTQKLDEEPIDKIHDYRACFDSSTLKVWHLGGKDRTWKISKITRVRMKNRDGDTDRKPALYFDRVPYPLIVNKTNGATIEQLYGRDPHEWIGQLLTLFPTTTQVGRNTVDCIRIRNKRPSAKGADADTELSPVDPEAEAERDAIMAEAAQQEPAQ